MGGQQDGFESVFTTKKYVFDADEEVQAAVRAIGDADKPLITLSPSFHPLRSTISIAYNHAPAPAI